MVIPTRTDPWGAYSWRIHDIVDQLRLLAGSTTHVLPADDDLEERWIVGSAEDAWLQLLNEAARISRRHAALVRRDGGWKLVDLNSKNGISLDGDKMSEVILVSGAEIGVGRLTFVAESKLLRELQEILRRLLGWNDDLRGEIDAAVGNIRNAATRHQPLVLCAPDSHTMIARLLHAYTIGANRPFIVCERRSASKTATHKDRPTPRAATYEDGMPALAAAAGGTLVVFRNRLPADFEQVLAAVRKKEQRVLLIVCGRNPARGSQIHPQLVVPSLASRGAELDRIIDAFAAEAPAHLRGALTPEERAWVKAQPKLSFLTIKTGTQRALASRAADGEVTRAAELAGVAHGSLSTWFARRPDLPDDSDDDDHDDGDDQW